METFLIKATQLILALSILVVIHEFGHFLFARLFGVKVEKFYIFFNPWRSLFKWKPGRHVGVLNKIKFNSEDAQTDYEENAALEKAIRELEEAKEKEAELKGENTNNFLSALGLDKNKNKAAADEAALKEAHKKVEVAQAEVSRLTDIRIARDESEYAEEKKAGWWKRFWKNTEYGIGWLPFGGYCRISGMIDESMDTEAMKRPPKPWEFRTKPAWQRLLVMIAGVLFNFLTAIIIYAGIVYATGEQYIPFREAKMGMEYSGEAKKIGFKDGDIPLTADGKPLEHPGEDRLTMAQASVVTVLRDGRDTVDIKIPANFIFALDNEAKSDTAKINFMTYRMPTRIIGVQPGEGADKGGIKEGDEIIAIDSISTPSVITFLTTLPGHDGQKVNLTILRKNQQNGTDTLTRQVQLSDNSKMGVMLELDPTAFFKSENIHYSLLQSIPRGMEMGTDKLVAYAKSMKMVFTKEGAKSIGGFGSIGAIFPDRWDWIAFWNIAAFLSVALAFMNIIPIPGLDGGHVFFLLYEVVFRRKPSDKFMERAQIVGMTFLLLLLVYANGMDIVRLFK